MFLRKLFRLVPKDPFTQGLQHVDRGELRQALLAFAPLLDSPDDSIRATAALYACEVNLQLGDDLAPEDPDSALEFFESASELQPNFADIHNRVGMIRLQRGETRAAERRFRQALEINPNYFLAHLNLCEALRRQTGCAGMLEEVRRLRHRAPDLYARKLEELLRLVESGSEAAVDAQLHMIREMNPSTREILRQSALRALREDRPEHAIRILEDLVEDRSRFPDLLQLLGLSYSKLGDTRAAEEAFRAALKIHPGYQKARINLALALMEQDRMFEAEGELQLVLENDPTHPLALSALEEIRVLAREVDRA